MKKDNSDEISSRNSVPILAWDFHYEYVNELKAIFADLKKVSKISNQFDWNQKHLKIEERIKEEVILITDLDLKIVFASTRIKTMTGYTEDEVLGKTPKMFQGTETSDVTLKEIREAIKLQLPFEKTIENYKKNGRAYKCKINGIPVFNLKGAMTHFITFESVDKNT